MFLEFTDEQLELRESARAALARVSPARQPTGAPPPPPDDGEIAATDRSSVDAEIGWLGWPALAVDVDHGGLGRTFVELAVVLEELGRAAAPGTFLATTTQFAPVVREAGSAAQAHRFLAGVASGELAGTVATHESGRWEPDAVTSTAERDGDGWLLRGHKLHVLGAPAVHEVVVSARRDDGPLGLFVVPADELTFKRTDSVDGTRSIADVELNGVWVPDARLLGEPAADATAAFGRALRESFVALALDSLGACAALVDAAQVTITEGHAPGQATEHALADMVVAIETTRALVYEAVATVAAHDRGGVHAGDHAADKAASMAKAAGGSCQRLVTTRCLEIHAHRGPENMGALESWIGRARTDALLFGTTADHRRIVAGLLLSTRGARGAQLAQALLG
jgi:alkylation response protein AidB-like acyl-CoA dehydrogenase